MSRKSFTASVVESLHGEREPEIIEAIVRNFCVEPNLAKLALRRAIRSYKMRKIKDEKR